MMRISVLGAGSWGTAVAAALARKPQVQAVLWARDAQSVQAMAQTRRNILLNGIGAQALNSLVGQIFWVGHIQCRGTELCTPCPRPSQLSLQSGFQEAFDGRGGLRAEVLRGGEVAIGDVLRCE